MRVVSMLEMTMTRIRLLILLLALVALPLRGMAAVAMWHCAEDQRSAAGASAHQHAGHDHAGNGPAAAHAGHDASAEADEAPGGVTTHLANAVCMIATGGPVVTALWQDFSFASIGADRIPFFEHRFTGVVPAQLDRPPRSQTL